MIGDKLLLLMLLVASLTQTTLSETLLLADCPQGPTVIGEYYNNGKKCVRDRNEITRDVIDADGNKCPQNYQRYGAKCHSVCPKGYNAKRGRCIQLRDTLSIHYMTCPDSLHKVGAFCCHGDQCIELMQKQEAKRNKNKPDTPLMPNFTTIVECNLDEEIPGKFYYNSETNHCVRTQSYIPRIWEKLPRDKKNRVVGDSCDPETHVQVLGGCQLKCPANYTVRKGMCQLKPCSIAVDESSIASCPEGKYRMQKSLL